VEKLTETGKIVELTWDWMSGEDGVFRQPAWTDIEARIKSLDTPEFSCVFLRATNHDVLTVAGDPEHGFLVFVSDNQRHYYVLAPSHDRKGKVNIVIGFQPGEYSNRVLVDIETALTIAHVFFETGCRDESVSWTEDYASVE
jgi:hypothetical protein